MTSSSFELWQPPVQFRGHVLPEWPKGVYPDPFETFVNELARSTETPVELSALMTLPAVATAAQGKYQVQIKPDYCEPLNIWTSVALPPGSRKSAVQGACTQPLVRFETLLKQQVEPLRIETEAKNKIFEARLKELRQKASKAEADELEKISEEIFKLEKSIRPAIAIPQLWTSDITPENLATIMADNHGCMAVLSDEAGIFDILAGRYSGGIPNLDLVLKAHSGTPCRVNRASKPPIFLENPTLTMGLSPQPGHLEGMARNSAFRGRGLIARFLFALPQSNLGSRTLDEKPIDPTVVDSYQRALEAILRLDSPGCNEVKEKVKLRLSEEAFDVWRLYSLAIEIRMSDQGLLAHITDWAGKLPGAIARIAALLHVMRYAHAHPEASSIHENDMLAAIKIGGFLQSHALAVFDLLGQDKNLSGAKKIVSWLKKNPVLEFTRRECHRAHKSHFEKVSELDASLNLLVDHNYLKEKPQEVVAHRPSKVYLVNHLIYEEEPTLNAK